MKHIIPPTKGTKFHYPWEKMEVGDWFMVPDAVLQPYTMIAPANRRLKPKKFSCAKQGQDFVVARVS